MPEDNGLGAMLGIRYNALGTLWKGAVSLALRGGNLDLIGL